MKGTIPQKIGRVVADLCVHPQYMPRTIAHNVLGRKTPADLELPWFSYAAIDFLEDFLEPHMNVCEYGSGGSTLFFSRRVSSVFSIEDNSEWFKLVSARLEQKSIDNVTLKLCPFDFKNPVGFEKSDYLHAIPEDRFDVIVVDGYPELNENNGAEHFRVFRSVGPGRPGVTSTDVYFY
jgi:hypothetical protein